MSDLNDYPTDEQLQFIRDYDLGKLGPQGMLGHLEKIWHWPEMIVWASRSAAKQEGKELTIMDLELHTGGWSGNEDIIVALETTVFWLMYWEKSVKGGHYYFEIPEFK